MDYKILELKSQPEFRSWLDANSATVAGVWLRIYKKASGIDTVTYAQALDEALCYGWIDGQRKSYDDISFLQKFTPRRPRSMWSKRNITYVERLTATGQMTKHGLREVESAKADGRWDAAYDGPSSIQVPDYFADALSKNPKASVTFENLNKTNRYAILWRLHTVKTDATRHRLTEKFIAMLEAGQSLH